MEFKGKLEDNDALRRLTFEAIFSTGKKRRRTNRRQEKITVGIKEEEEEEETSLIDVNLP